MNILIDKIRVRNFRSLKGIEITLTSMTILVGANNSGKTTLLKALNSVLGFTRNQINQDDLFIDKAGNRISNEIIIDIRVVPADENGSIINSFDNKWNSKLGIGIQPGVGTEFFAFRTKYTFGIDDNPTISYFLFSNWENELLNEEEFKGISQIRNNIKMFFIDAQRDILEDSKQRTSFFGKMVSQLDYGVNLDAIKQQIAELNNNAIENF
jgi:putative ATP-dependent endonuclease of OLD family